MSTGYKYRRLQGVFLREHRVVWEEHNGPIPEGMQIDHINGDKQDNRIENLRLATNQQNSCNRKGANSNSKSGVRGVQQLPSGSYRVRVGNSHLGTFKDLELAELVAEEARHKYYGEFA